MARKRDVERETEAKESETEAKERETEEAWPWLQLAPESGGRVMGLGEGEEGGGEWTSAEMIGCQSRARA